ncbi:RNA 3'-terminal phosphate cyclase-like protein [Hyalella azteca]|uniref:RNA 3'-terminal phosphate cyclase-like protein n=1 Tax=Hyalella azteca TaxID=294128 RepID=A0A8B7NGF2_HYAAZ|nr:RNA 3'-terminal phosphate cyclase-like protein [Hyalella azteca]
MASEFDKDLVYEGCNFLRQRLVLSCLSGKKVKINNIRAKDECPGVCEHEMNLIRLFDQLCNGAKLEVSRSGTSFTFIPGILIGGSITHTCEPSRGIGYYLEPVMMLAPFCKRPIHLTLKGITNCNGDVSVDQLRYSLLPLLRKFLQTDEGVSLVMVKRGLPPCPSGVVEFTCPVRKELKPFVWTDQGQVKKVRGMCFTRRVAPVVGNRMIDVVKKYIHRYLTDVYFVLDNAKGPSPGFGISLNCITTTSTIFTGEAITCQDVETVSTNLEERSDRRLMSPEDVGELAVCQLLQEIKRGGVVDGCSQAAALLFMALTPRDVSKILIGPLTTQSMYMLRHIRDFLKVKFKMEPEPRDDELSDDDDEEERGNKRRKTGCEKLILTCVGSGFTNFSKGSI